MTQRLIILWMLLLACLTGNAQLRYNRYTTNLDNALINGNLLRYLAIAGPNVYTNADGSYFIVPGGGGGGGNVQAGSGIVVVPVVVGTNVYYVISTATYVLTNGYTGNVAFDGEFTSVNTLDAVVVNVANNVSAGNFLGSGYGLFGIPLQAVSPYSTAPGTIVSNSNGRFVLAPSNVRLPLTNGVAQLTNGECVVYSSFAYETNTFLVTHHSLDGSTSIVDYTNVIPGVSFTIVSAKTNDTNYASWAILNGGGLQNITNGPTATYLLTSTAGTGGQIYPAGTTTIITGGNASFTATPGANFAIGTWTSNSVVEQTGGATYTVSQVTANTTVQVNFTSPASFVITASAGSGGTINPSGSVTVQANTTQAFTGTPNPGNFVNQWLSNSVLVQTGGSTFITAIVTNSYSLEVTFTGSTVYTNVFNGLVAWWKLNEGAGLTAFDSTGNGYNARLSGAFNPLDQWGTGFYSFYNDFFVTTANTALTPPSFSYTAWVEYTNSGNGAAIIGGDGAGYPELYIAATPNYLALYPSGGATYSLSTPTVVPSQTWEHVAVTYAASSGATTFYLNGVATGAAPNPQTFYNGATQIGGSYDGYDFYGKIKLVDIFNRVLTPAEVNDIFQLGSQ